MNIVIINLWKSDESVNVIAEFWKAWKVLVSEEKINAVRIFNFIEGALRHGYSPVNLLHVFKTSFCKNTYGGMLLEKADAEKPSIMISILKLRWRHWRYTFIWRVRYAISEQKTDNIKLRQLTRILFDTVHGKKLFRQQNSIANEK